MKEEDKDMYRTIEQQCEGIYRDKGSKFLAYAYPFTDEGDLKELLSLSKTIHPKARHHCWAYRLSPDREVYRINDDGEPSGTAGRPILNTILSYDITNILIVVVRYFGGTLLGVPGLINAYKMSTQDCLENANIVERTVNSVFDITFEYINMNDVMRLIKEYDWNVLAQSFDLSCKLRIEIRNRDIEILQRRIDELNEVGLTFIEKS